MSVTAIPIRACNRLSRRAAPPFSPSVHMALLGQSFWCCCSQSFESNSEQHTLVASSAPQNFCQKHCQRQNQYAQSLHPPQICRKPMLWRCLQGASHQHHPPARKGLCPSRRQSSISIQKCLPKIPVTIGFIVRRWRPGDPLPCPALAAAPPSSVHQFVVRRWRPAACPASQVSPPLVHRVVIRRWKPAACLAPAAPPPPASAFACRATQHACPSMHPAALCFQLPSLQLMHSPCRWGLHLVQLQTEAGSGKLMMHGDFQIVGQRKDSQVLRA